MRNTLCGKGSLSRTAVAGLVAMAFAPFLPGCLDGGSRQILNRAYTELDSRQYDDADSDADEFLRAHPNGSGVGEAYYLKGRIEEQRAQDPQVSSTHADKQGHLDAARDEYTRGLESIAPSTVKALLHSGVANVDFYEEDYSTAAREWQIAYDNLTSEDQRAWVLYHIGRCDQRLGMFDKADEAFAMVQRLYPASEASIRAASRTGMKAFFVEVGSFPSEKNAETAAAELRKEGYAASRSIDIGRQIVRVGPITSYAEAKAFQGRLRAQYPGAIISP